MEHFEEVKSLLYRLTIIDKRMKEVKVHDLNLSKSNSLHDFLGLVEQASWILQDGAIPDLYSQIKNIILQMAGTELDNIKSELSKYSILKTA